MANSNQTNANASPSIGVTTTPIPFSEIITQAESTSASLKELASSVSADTTAEIVERDLPDLTKKMDAQLEETAQVIEGRASLEKLKIFEDEWRTLTKILPDWKDDLTSRAKKLEDDLKQLNTLDEKWKKTLEELKTVETRSEIIVRIEEILSTIAQTRKQIETAQTRSVSLQSKVAEQQKRVDDSLESLKQTRESLVGRLLVQDSPAIWSENFWARAQKDISQNAKDSLAIQIQSLNDFARRNMDRIIIHFLVFGLFAGILIFLRRTAHPRVEKNPN